MMFLIYLLIEKFPMNLVGTIFFKKLLLVVSYCLCEVGLIFGLYRATLSTQRHQKRGKNNSEESVP